MKNIAELHEAIQAAGIHIVGLSGTTNTRIDFAEDATAEQRAAARAIVDGWDWEDREAKANAFTEAIAAGFDTGLGWRLPLDETSRGELDKLRNQLREGIDLGFLTNDSPCPIQLLDTAGIGHSMTVGQARQLIFAGGNYYAGLVAAAR